MTSTTSMPYTDARLVGEAFETLIGSAVPDDLSGQLVDQARPAVRFAVKPAGRGVVPLAASRFGGEPDLPSEVRWPSWNGPDGADPDRPLSFFAQVDLASMSRGLDLPLPSEGLLLFFSDFGHDDEILGMYRDEHDGSRVLHVPATGLSRRPTPTGAFRQLEALLHPLLVTTIPGIENWSITEDDWEAWEQADILMEQHLAALAPAGWSTGGRHQLGGHARAIQHPVEEECLQAAANVHRRDSGFDHERWAEVAAQAAEWRLLLQLDSDDQLNVMYGDAGTIYWAAPVTSLQHQDWASTWFNFQCG